MAGPEVTEVREVTAVPAEAPEALDVPVPEGLHERAVMARPGFGKYTVPDELPPGTDHFAHLGMRERYVARVIDALPEGASISIKTLAKAQPLYGQSAVESALNTLRYHGHLRGYRAPMPGSRRVHWIQLTYFTRRARPVDLHRAWWTEVFDRREAALAAEFAAREAAGPATAPIPGPRTPESRTPEPRTPEPRVPESRVPGRLAAPVDDRAPTSAAARRTAYDVLAALAHTDPRLSLTERECRSLTPLAAQWIDRGVTPARLTRALTTGLPKHIGSPGALTRTRLRIHMPEARRAAAPRQADGIGAGPETRVGPGPGPGAGPGTRAERRTLPAPGTASGATAPPEAGKPPAPEPPGAPPGTPAAKEPPAQLRCGRCGTHYPRELACGTFNLCPACWTGRTDRPAIPTQPADRAELAAMLGRLLKRVDEDT